ncbi:MAG: TIGR00701 family protein [Gammaproteobacteria bacterium RIFCSPHIGHO2_12_FULL_37_34]|nr:MAG: TIGR00701 family protein [Gammaproteobacteria bacterium RIFCSPHIGHO2_12_FULL_37_34]
MLWIKSFHIIFMVTWFSGLFYLPRLFVYHTLATDKISMDRFKIMERKLYFGIATPGAIFTILFGLWLIGLNPHAYMQMAWLHIKLSVVFLLLLYHIYLGLLLHDFKINKNKHGHVFYRILNEIPVIFLVVIVVLAIAKPFGIA